MTRWPFAMLLALAAAAQQGALPTVRIVSPSEGSYQMGDAVIRAQIEPASQPVQQMTFFDNGHVVCRVESEPFECAWNAGAELREHTLRVVALLPGGRRISGSVHTEGAPVNEVVEVLRVPVTVSVFAGSRFVTGLPQTAFRVYEDDVRQKTAFFEARNSTLELAVGVDISESMTEAIEGLKQNVKRFLSALRPADRVTVGAFNERYYVVASPNVDLATRLRNVEHLAPWGMTSLYETILSSFDQLSTRSGRRSLVIFSDGEDTSSRVRREAVEKRAELNDAVLFIIGQGKVLESSDLRSLCERLATKSGGRAFFPKDMEGLTAAFDTILDELSNQYFLTYEPPSSRRDGRWHRLRVEVDGGYQVRAPQGYTLKPR
jgi:Ca-activated chloride channel homolog